MRKGSRQSGPKGLSHKGPRSLRGPRGLRGLRGLRGGFYELISKKKELQDQLHEVVKHFLPQNEAHWTYETKHYLYNQLIKIYAKLNDAIQADEKDCSAKLINSALLARNELYLAIKYWYDYINDTKFRLMYALDLN